MYVDGFVLPIPKAKVDTYREIAKRAGELWREHGALDYKECLAEDVQKGEVTDFFRSVDCKDDETVVFAWISFASREERDRVNKAVMADDRMSDMGHEAEQLDMKRLVYGGFEVIVDV